MLAPQIIIGSFIAGVIIGIVAMIMSIIYYKKLGDSGTVMLFLLGLFIVTCCGYMTLVFLVIFYGVGGELIAVSRSK